MQPVRLNASSVEQTARDVRPATTKTTTTMTPAPFKASKHGSRTCNMPLPISTRGRKEAISKKGQQRQGGIERSHLHATQRQRHSPTTTRNNKPASHPSKCQWSDSTPSQALHCRYPPHPLPTPKPSSNTKTPPQPTPQPHTAHTLPDHTTHSRVVGPSVSWSSSSHNKKKSHNDAQQSSKHRPRGGAREEGKVQTSAPHLTQLPPALAPHLLSSSSFSFSL